MNLSIEQIAELLAGIARSQQAIIDAIESESGGWRNTHLLPKLTTASNMRLATPRLMDIPSRILLRSQGRVAMDVATITRALEEAAKGAVLAAPVPPAEAAAIGAGVSAPAAIATAAVPLAGIAASEDLGNFFDN
jgi:hypothetical protein